MAITKLVSYVVECDLCGEQSHRSPSQIGAAYYAKRLGWQTAVDGEDPGSDLCPMHAGSDGR